MPKYALIDNALDTSPTAILREETRNFSAQELETVARKFGPDKHTRIVPSIVLPAPAFDPATQRLGPMSAPTIEPDRVTRIRTVVDLSPEELADKTERQQAAIIIERLKSGTATEKQKDRVLIYLLKQNVI